MKQISESEISGAITTLQNIYSFLDTSVAGRFGELQAFLGTNVLGALIPAGTVNSDEEGLTLIQIRKQQIQSLIDTLNSLSTVVAESTSDTCIELINALNNLANQSTTIRNIVRTELSLNNTNIITPINTNIDSSRETLALQIYQGFSTTVTGLNSIIAAVALLSNDLSTINARTIQIYDKTIEILTRIHETRQELKQTADRVIQIWDCIHTPESTVENPICRPFGGGGTGGDVDFTEILDDLTAILACCSVVDTYLRDFDARVIAEFNTTKTLINNNTTSLTTEINQNQTLLEQANTRILNVQVAVNNINNSGGGSLPDGIGDTIYNTFNEINNIKNTVNNITNETNQIRNTVNNTNNTVNNIYYNTENTFNSVSTLNTTVNNINNKTDNLYQTLNNLYQTVNNITNNTTNNNVVNNPPEQCLIEMGVGLPYPCSENNVDLTPILTAIKNLRDELIKTVNTTVDIYDCDGILAESYLVSGDSFNGVFNYFNGIIKKIDNVQKILCEQEEKKCIPLLIEPSELPIGFTKETQMYVTWESESGSRWHTTVWNINPDILAKLQNNQWTITDWNEYFSITIQRGHKASKQFSYLDIKYTEDKYKKIVFYLSSNSECNRLFNWVSSKWILSGIDYKVSSINNIQSFPVHAESYIYSIGIQVYLNGVKTDETYCLVNPNI